MLRLPPPFRRPIQQTDVEASGGVKPEGGRGHAAAEIAEAVAEGWQTGLGEPCAISAEHGGGLSDLYVVRYTMYPASLPRS